MKRTLRFVLVLVAAAMHLAVPMMAYGSALQPALPGDFCSASRVVPMGAASSGFPIPSSGDHHCAHAPCCAGGAVNAAAPPPPDLVVFHLPHAGVQALEATSIAAPLPTIIAAQPRGPPVLS
jgi:hypothetical protein